MTDFYLVPSDMRDGSGRWFTHGLELTVDDADDNPLSDAISAMSRAFDLYTSDHFLPEPGDVPETTTTLDLAGSGARNLYVPKRIRSITSVSLRDRNGTLTLQDQDPPVYRVTQSLVNGERSEADLDMLSVIPGRSLSGTGFWDSDLDYNAAWSYWPLGINTVQLTGTFSWDVTPEQVKRAVALMVYDAIKPQGDVLRRADRWSTAEANYQVGQTTPTGIPEADRIIAQYTRNRLPAL